MTGRSPEGEDRRTSLRELEKRLENEPDNLSLRVTVAGMLSEVGRKSEAVELYRSVALAYRARGRTQQAIAVCRSIVELAPHDLAVQALLKDLQPPVPGIPSRSSTELDTPLPKPMPYHVADPTAKVPQEDDVATDTDRPKLTGLAQAARRISGLIAQDQLPSQRDDLLAELETRQVPRLSASELAKVSQPPPTVPVDRVDDAELRDLATPVFATAPWRRPATLPPIRDTPIDLPTELDPLPHDPDDDLTSPRELHDADAGTNAFFLALPANRRADALARCTAKTVRAGTTLIRQGDSSHPLIIVVAGKLELRIERANGTVVVLDTIDGGQYIGEAALLARAPASANVVAIADSEILGLAPHVLFELAGAYPGLWAAIKDTAERRTRQYEKLIRASP